MTDRGVIRNEKYGSQIIDFSELRYGKITPTDIDGYIEYQNKLHIFIEYKFENCKMLGGQKLAFERLIDDLNKVKPTILLQVSHNRTEGSIDGAYSTVTGLYTSSGWADIRRIKDKSVKFIADSFIEVEGNLVEFEEKVGIPKIG